MAPEPVLTLKRREKSLAHARNGTPAVQPVAILTELSQLIEVNYVSVIIATYGLISAPHPHYNRIQMKLHEQSVRYNLILFCYHGNWGYRKLYHML
jgi:hypothetical protein